MRGLAGILNFWTLRPRRPEEPGFAYIYVNQDGSARELSPGEQAYLSQEFRPGDGGRPYVKVNYQSRDGWGSQSGYLLRRQLPKRVAIAAVHPGYDEALKALREDKLGFARAAGDVITTNANGSMTISRDRAIPHRERFERARDHMLEAQRRREALAKL